MAYKLQLKRGLLASLPNGSVGEPLFTTDTFDLYVGKGDGSNIKLQKFIASGSSSQFLKGDGSLDSTTYQGVLSGSGIVKSTGGTISYLTDNSANWDAAYNDKINSASVSGTTTKTLTLTQQDGGTISASWSDYDTAPVTSVFGRTGNVVATSGDYTTSLVTEGTNLYFTDARARAAITLTTTGSSGSATYVGGTLNIPTYTLAGLGGVPTSRSLTINGTSYDLSADRSWSVGTVTSVDLSVPTGFAISGNPITSSGTLALAFASGYSLPTNASQTNWDAAYNDKINSASVTGTTTKTLTLNQQDGGTITASWTDDNTDAVTSVFGRTGNVVATSGDYTTTQVTEGTNLYYTEARVSANTDVAANTAARHNAVTLGTANGLSLSTQQLSLALASGSTTGALSSTDWTTFNSKQAALNGTGFVKISGTTISYDNSTYYLASNPSNYITLSSISGSSPINYNNTTGQITIQLANGSQNGYLSSTDWNTFNNKQSALTNPVTGTGTTNYIPKFTGSTTLGNSSMSDDGSAVTVQAHMNVYGGDVRFDDERFVYSFAGGTVGQYRSGVYYDGSGLNQRFYINNSEQMRLTSTGLGIGTSSPSEKLSLITSGTNGSGLNITNSTSTGYVSLFSLGSNGFGVSGWSNAILLEAVPTSTGNFVISSYSNNIVFQTGVRTERMRIDSSGNLGLGTTSPAYKLQVNNSTADTHIAAVGTAPSLQLMDLATSPSYWATIAMATNNGDFLSGSEGGDLILANRGTTRYNIRFGFGTATRMVLNSSGNLGLGVAPSNAYADSRTVELGASGILWSERDASIYNSMSIGSNFYYDALGNLKYKNTGIAASRFTQYQGQHQWFTAASGTAGNAITFTQAMTLDASGNLLVGLTTGGRLSVRDAGGNDTHFGLGANYDNYISAGTNGVTIFRNATTERMRITSGGNVGIGTSSPTFKLSTIVAASASNVNAFEFSNATNASLELYLKNDVTTLNAGGTGTFVFANGGSVTERLRITSSGNILVGTTTALTTANGGILQVNNAYGMSITNGGQALRLIRSGVNTWDFGQGTFTTQTGFGITDVTAANTALFIQQTTCNIGIGTSAPSEKLHVNGNIKTTSTGWTAGAWKLGTAQSGTPSTNHYITVEIDGQIYSIPALQGTP